MVAVEGADVGRIAANAAYRHAVIPVGVFQEAGEQRYIGGGRFEDAFIISAKRGKTRRFADHPDGGGAVGEGDEPQPHVPQLGRGGDEDFVAVVGGVCDVVFDVGKDGHAFRQHGRAFEVKEARQDAAIATGIKHEAGVHGVAAAVFCLHGDFRAVAGVAVGGDFVAEADFRALFAGFFKQHQVKIGAFDLVGDAGAGGVFLGEVEGGVALAPGEGGAVFHLEGAVGGGALHGGGHFRLAQHFHAGGQQAFADDEAREVAFFEDEDVEVLLAQQGGSDGAGGAAADDEDVTGFHGVPWWWVGRARWRRSARGRCRWRPWRRRRQPPGWRTGQEYRSWLWWSKQRAACRDSVWR